MDNVIASFMCPAAGGLNELVATYLYTSASDPLDHGLRERTSRSIFAAPVTWMQTSIYLDSLITYIRFSSHASRRAILLHSFTFGYMSSERHIALTENGRI